MSSGFYVDNLPAAVTVEALKEVFSQIGEVRSVQVKTAYPRKKCFVEMCYDLDAYRAIKSFHGATIGNQKILLTEA